MEAFYAKLYKNTNCTNINTAAQSQITVTGKSIILQEKLKTNFFLYMKYGITYAVDAAVYVFMLVYCFKLHMNCRRVWKVFVKKFGRVI